MSLTATRTESFALRTVSRQFSNKFHAFFNKLLLKGNVLGIVSHYFWKKEYQNRGALHYHVLLWIQDAPVIGVDDPQKVLAWIQERITCKLPDKNGDPDCMRWLPGTRCTSAVHTAREKSSGVESLSLPANSSSPESRVKLLFCTALNARVAESSLALSHYVTGYVKKAEKSSLQEMWQEISDNSTLYGRLWKFGIRALKSHECSLYEASDRLLGDHLLEKSETVQYIPVGMPHKRRRRLKNHSNLKELAETNPESEDIFMEDVIGTHYSKRPNSLDDLCLHDFVANLVQERQ